jgi:hypothetical protein
VVYQSPLSGRIVGKPETGKQSRPMEGGFFGFWEFYCVMRYVLSPSSFFTDSTLSPIFLVSVPLMKPRML